MKKLAPSILSADFTCLGEEVRAIEKAGADYVHIDVMDGHFVPNITVGPLVVQAVKRITKLPLDVHLMIDNPDKYLEDFIQAGSDILSVHVEACPHLNRTIQAIKNLGVKTSIALNPATSLSSLDHILEEVDMVLLMTVNPGFAGQKFIRSILPKIKKLRETLEQKSLRVDIEVDGGINLDNITQVSRAGANIFVAGSAVFKEKDYRVVLQIMREKIGN